MIVERNQLHLPNRIAIVGQEGSGKDSYGRHLEELGFLHVSAGDALRERARSKGYADPISREVLSEMGDQLKEEFGPGPIALSSLQRYLEVRDQYPAGLAISGFRRAGEVQTYKQHGGVVLWIAASTEKRFANQHGRGRDDVQALTEFTMRSVIEWNGATDGGADGVNLQAVKNLADCEVSGEGTLAQMCADADRALAYFV